ncbi:restriction endonuclease subunit S [Limosilactobacillus reuteri]|uniref:restriction endonuclease subunit S n=1 Tax=Limosilactobacillus reuteri TaxID=1598 RepID=UPI002D1F9A77|nr:restriction endonuclease subunit S [Limosilactobacillus reuteri]MCC4411837.1 restriction endonuclease subunit S [Limosilactobacillus reuteri]
MNKGWEQRKLGEFYSFKNGLNKGKEYFGHGVPIVNYTDVYHHRSLELKDLKGRVELTSNEVKNNSAKTGDLFFTRTSETIDEIGFPAILLSASNDTVFSGFLIRVRPIGGDPLDLLFKKYVFYTKTFRQEMMRKSTITTRALTSGKNLSSMIMAFPDEIKEQNSIGNLLTKLDNLITLQQRKLEQLKQLKKAILQIIASNRLLLHTKKVDMIKVRVADTYKITRGNVLARSEISNVRTSKYPYPVYSSQTKNHGLMGYYKDFLFKNAITWTTDGANAGTVKYRKGKFYSTNVNGVLLSSEGLANQLTAELLNLVAFKYVSHVGNPKLMNNTMGEILFNIPKSVETQQYFSDCIELVINLIGKQEKATDKLNKLKNYLLQKLFI